MAWDIADVISDLREKVQQQDARIKQLETLLVKQASDDQQKGFAQRVVIKGETYYIRADGYAVLGSALIASLAGAGGRPVYAHSDGSLYC